MSFDLLFDIEHTYLVTGTLLVRSIMVQSVLSVFFCQLVSPSRVPKLVSASSCGQTEIFFSYFVLVGITAGEAKNPTKTVPRAIRNTFWRIIIFYICTILLLGMCIPYNNEDLQNPDGGPGTASFTLVFKLAGIEAGAHVINAIVLTRYVVDVSRAVKIDIEPFDFFSISVLSACNSSLYTTSRTLMGLARDSNAPAFLGKVNKYGSPFW